MHGGAPSALFTHVCEQHDPGTADFVARITVELLRPVPLKPLTMRVRTIRPGRKVQWLEAALLDDDEREVDARDRAAVAQRQRSTRGGSVELEVATRRPAATRVAPRSGSSPAGDVGYWSANEVAIVAGNWVEPGPGVAWFRLRCPVVAGEPMSAATRGRGGRRLRQRRREPVALHARHRRSTPT